MGMQNAASSSSAATTTAPAPKAGNKRRAPMSCDRCKNRKTKCVDPVPGPCQFCASIGAVCHLDPSRRRQRPYYHISEEEFRYMTKALEHFLPDVELNLQSLREIVQSLEAAPPPAARLPPAVVDRHSYDGACDAASDSAMINSDDSRTTPTSTSGTVQSDETAVTIEEINELHGELGWLRLDSKGTYRHVGADSGYGFHAAVRSLRQRRESEASKSDLLPPFTVAPPLPPPSTPDSSAAGSVGVGMGVPSPHQSSHPSRGVYNSASSSSSSRRTQIFLPRRDLCNRCVSRFFRDIQSIYWFWSAERFYALLDRLYAGDRSSATPAMLCSLYSILALTCESEGNATQTALGVGVGEGPPPAARYLSLAKTLVPALCDEADADSVRALSLLALALQSSMFNNTAYIYIGAAARIALTLGLHLQRAIEPKGCLQRQVDLRLYSTLFLLDLDVALCYGNPPAISDDHAASMPQDLSEQILSPGSYMPLDYLTVSCQLCQIKRHLSKLLYARAGASSSCSGSGSSSGSSSSAPRPSIAAVSEVLGTLRAWYNAIPPHLRDVSRAASFHQRSVSVLHLRYWSATIFATRPFLLYSALHAESLATLPAAKRASFEEFNTTCIDAAKQSLSVICIMRDSGLLSSLVTLDTGCILEVLQVFLLALALARGPSEQAQQQLLLRPDDDVRTCLHTLQGMEQIFWTHHALTEVMAQLEENGLLNGDHGFSPPQQGQDDTPTHFFLDINQQHQQLQQHQLQQHNNNITISGVMEAYFSHLHDPFFAVSDDAAAAALLGDHFQDEIRQHSTAQHNIATA